MKRQDSLKDLRKKFPQAAKLVNKFLESECCDDEKTSGKKNA